jgi:hypothetical protein
VSNSTRPLTLREISTSLCLRVRGTASAVALAVVIVGCASQPPARPPRPLTHDEALRQREGRILHASALAYKAGEDDNAVYENLERQACLSDAAVVEDPQQRASAIRQCQELWPVRLVAVPSQQGAPIQTSCVRSEDGNLVNCASQ